MKYLIVGECGACISDARIMLRRVGVEYVEVNRFDLRDDPIFESSPELYTMAMAVYYNKETGKYINLKKVELTDEVRKAIKSL